MLSTIKKRCLMPYLVNDRHKALFAQLVDTKADKALLETLSLQYFNEFCNTYPESNQLALIHTKVLVLNDLINFIRENAR